MDRWGVDPRVLASGLDPEGEPIIDGIRPYLHLNEWQRDVVFVNKLGEAEAVLEASAIVVLGLGSKDMHLFYELLNDICPKELVLLVRMKTVTLVMFSGRTQKTCCPAQPCVPLVSNLSCPKIDSRLTNGHCFCR